MLKMKEIARETKKMRFLATALFTISDPLNIMDAFFSHMLCVCRVSVACMRLTLQSPYQCPLKPSFPVGSRQNCMKDVARGLLLPGLGPATAQRASLDTSPSIKYQTRSRTHSIPTAEGIMSLQKRQVLFIFLQLRQGYG